MHEESGPSWGMRGLRKWLGTAPETRDELLKLVQDSRRFLEPDTVAMLEGVLDLPATKIREVMTPRTTMISLQEDDELLDILHVLVESAHSRFPVMMLHQAIRKSKSGDVVEVFATDNSTSWDIPKFCMHLGHELLLQEERLDEQGNKEFHYLVKKGE